MQVTDFGSNSVCLGIISIIFIFGQIYTNCFSEEMLYCSTMSSICSISSEILYLRNIQVTYVKVYYCVYVIRNMLDFAFFFITFYKA